MPRLSVRAFASKLKWPRVAPQANARDVRQPLKQCRYVPAL